MLRFGDRLLRQELCNAEFHRDRINLLSVDDKLATTQIIAANG